MAKDTKHNQYNPLPFQRSAYYERWEAREAKLREQQASCNHKRYVVYGSPFGDYAVCVHCDKNLGRVGDEQFRVNVVNKGVANA